MGNNKYTCNEYRQEMILLGLQRQLTDKNLSKEERQKILEEIRKIEEEMGMRNKKS